MSVASAEVLDQFNQLTRDFVEDTAKFTEKISSIKKNSFIRQVASEVGPKWEAALADLCNEDPE